MNVVSKLKSVVLATAVVLSASAVMVPQALAHACYGSGTITIKQIGKDYWYFQSGRVCGRYVT